MVEAQEFPPVAHAGYQAYLLRLWQEPPQSSWRFWLQDVATGQGQVFANLESLEQFLQVRTETPWSTGFEAEAGMGRLLGD